MNDAPAPEPVCPECGAPLALRHPDTPWWWRRKLWLQAATVALLAAWMGWKVWSEWPIPAPATTHPAGAMSVAFPNERFTLADVEQLAAEGRDDRLIRAIGAGLDDILPGTELTVAFVAPTGYVSEFLRYGWPSDLLVYRYDANYQDVYARTGATPVPLRGRTGWLGRTHTRERVDERGRRELRLVLLNALSSFALVLVLAWAAGWIVRAGLWRTGMFARAGKRRRDHAVRRLLTIALCGVAAVLLTLSLFPRYELSAILPKPWMPPTIATGLRAEDLIRLQRAGGSDKSVGLAILDAAAELTPTGETLLLGWNSPTAFSQMQITGGWPAGLVNGWRTWRLGPGERGKRINTVLWERGYLSVRTGTDGLAGGQTQWAFSLEHAAWPLVWLWAAWVGVGFALRLAWWRLHRRARARASAGLCVRCAYSVAPATNEALPRA